MIGRNVVPKVEGLSIRDDFESTQKSSPPQTKRTKEDSLKTERITKKRNKQEEIALGRYEKTISGSGTNK